MSRRMSEQEMDASSYDPITKKFTLRWVPKAPEAIVRRIMDLSTRCISELVELRFGCPHCHEDIEMQYETGKLPPKMTDELVEMIARFNNMRFTPFVSMLYRDSDNIKKFFDVLERLLEKLERRL